jgi:hypothetical protein
LKDGNEEIISHSEIVIINEVIQKNLVNIKVSKTDDFIIELKLMNLYIIYFTSEIDLSIEITKSQNYLKSKYDHL